MDPLEPQEREHQEQHHIFTSTWEILLTIHSVLVRSAIEKTIWAANDAGFCGGKEWATQ